MHRTLNYDIWKHRQLLFCSQVSQLQRNMNISVNFDPDDTILLLMLLGIVFGRVSWKTHCVFFPAMQNELATPVGHWACLLRGNLTLNRVRCCQICEIFGDQYTLWKPWFVAQKRCIARRKIMCSLFCYSSLCGLRAQSLLDDSNDPSSLEAAYVSIPSSHCGNITSRIIFMMYLVLQMGEIHSKKRNKWNCPLAQVGSLYIFNL